MLKRYLKYEPMCRARFLNVDCLPNARTPIVKMTDRRTYLDVDLSLSSPFPLQNTGLLKLCSLLDWRFRELVYSARRWLDERRLAKGPENLGISNYSMTLLVMFYLQTLGILPTLQLIVERFRRLRLFRPGQGDVFIDSVWEQDDLESGRLDFARNDWARWLEENPWPHLHENSQSPAELLAGFFQFLAAGCSPDNPLPLCSTFVNLRKCVVMPLDEVVASGRLPCSFRVRSGGLHVQDPFGENYYYYLLAVLPNGTKPIRDHSLNE